MSRVVSAITALILAALFLRVSAQEPDTRPLLRAADLVYTGAFRLPQGRASQETFEYGGRALTFDPASRSLILPSHDWYQWLADINIPEPGSSLTVSGLPTATLRQSFIEPFGNAAGVGSGSAALGGLLVWGNRLVMTRYLTYDATGSQSVSHYTRTRDLSRAENPRGPYQLTNVRAGFVAGYMAPIPVEWRAALGGPALAGLCCVSIISRTSLGPTATVFDPAELERGGAVNAFEVLGYPIERPTLGTCESTRTRFNCATTMGGIVFPEGTRSVLFFGRHGRGDYCYGEGGQQRRSPDDCIDPSDSAKGPHAYPYQYEVWAYDVLDLIAVRQGLKRPWEVQPYDVWTFDMPFSSNSRVIRGVTYDPVSRRIFMATPFTDGAKPLIQVLTVNITPSSGEVPPPYTEPEPPADPDPAPSPHPVPTPAPAPAPPHGTPPPVHGAGNPYLGR
jgi:hypothetical protein